MKGKYVLKDVFYKDSLFFEVEVIWFIFILFLFRNIVFFLIKEDIRLIEIVKIIIIKF